jgi:hypothetical protein
VSGRKWNNRGEMRSAYTVISVIRGKGNIEDLEVAGTVK